MSPSRQAPADNPLLGSFYMTLAMACYVINDTLIKLVGDQLPLGTLILVRGGFAIVLILALGLASNVLRHWQGMISKPVLLRAAFDTTATFLFLPALFNLSIAVVTAILQTVPLVVMLFGAVFLKENIGWRRILAILAGFVGVLLVVQPGTADFNYYAVLVVGVVVLVAMRDTVTRKLPANTPSLVVTFSNVVMVTIAGTIYALYQGVQAVNPAQLFILSAASVFLVAATLLVILTMRVADISSTAPFRYTAILWSLISAFVVFNEVPDSTAAIGIVLIAVAGLYGLFRSR